jgi:hypothetical protein
MSYPRTEREAAAFLTEAVETLAADQDRAITVRSFSEAGVMSGNAGFAMRVNGKAEFQVTIVQSR